MRSLFFDWRGVLFTIGGATLLASITAAAQKLETAVDGAPVATTAIVQTPDAYYGRLVTLSAGVERTLSRTLFVVDQRRVVSGKAAAAGAPMLVVAPYMTAPPDTRGYMLLRGYVVKFEPAAVARIAPGFSLDIAADAVSAYLGQPALVATLVVDSTYAVLGRKPLPPVTDDDASVTSAMKVISPAYAALQTAASGSKAALVAEQAALLQSAFARTEPIWARLGRSVPADAARAAGAHAASIERAAASGNWDAVRTSASALGELCQSCHAAVRERQDDGTFRIGPAAP